MDPTLSARVGVDGSSLSPKKSSFTGEGAFDKLASGNVSPPASSDRSGTISGGSADRLGLRPAKSVFRVGERGTLDPRVVELEAPPEDELDIPLV